MTPITVPANTRTLVLTGASRGIGHATVKKFSAGGWRVITVSRQPFSALCPVAGRRQESCADRPRRARRREPRHRGDPRPPGRRPARCAGQQCGDLARRTRPAAAFGAIDTPFDLWRRVFNVNFFAPVALARGLMGELSEAHGLRRQRDLDRRQPGPSVRGLGLRHVEGGAGRPDPRDGARFRAARHPRQRDRARRDRHLDSIALEREKIVEEQIPLRRLGKPAEVAKAIYFLCDKGASLCGAEIHVNGGQHV